MRSDAGTEVLERLELDVVHEPAVVGPQHDSYTVQSDVEQQRGLHVVSLQITKGTFTRNTKTQVVLGPNNRWFVDNIELEPLKDLCSGVASH